MLEIWLKFASEIPYGLRHNSRQFTRAYVVWIRDVQNFNRYRRHSVSFVDVTGVIASGENTEDDTEDKVAI